MLGSTVKLVGAAVVAVTLVEARLVVVLPLVVRDDAEVWELVADVVRLGSVDES